jgi:hypothetical protein
MADPKKFPPGDAEYFVEIEVPDSPGDLLQGKFGIVKSDPEMDNTKPNFAAMRTMASEMDAFQERIPGSTRDRFKIALPKEGAVQKLAFRLSDADLLRLIPDCFESKHERQDIKGPVTDLWDRGIEFPAHKSEGSFIERNIPPSLASKKLPISWVLLVVVGLLCWEWLTRKLLRLA